MYTIICVQPTLMEPLQKSRLLGCVHIILQSYTTVYIIVVKLFPQLKA